MTVLNDVIDDGGQFIGLLAPMDITSLHSFVEGLHHMRVVLIKERTAIGEVGPFPDGSCS